MVQIMDLFDNIILFGAEDHLVCKDLCFQAYGEVVHRIANRKISSSSPALPTVLRVRDISNLSSHTVHSAECTGNCA